MAQIAKPWQLGYQDAASPVMREIVGFHDLLLVIITAITAFVLLLLLYVMVRFRASRNPTPSRTSHNTLLEVVWTVLPVAILVLIAVPSFKLLYLSDRTEAADMTIKITGRQFAWSYEYVDQDGMAFDSNLACQDLPSGGEDPCVAAGKELWHTGGKPAIRLLDVDNPLVVPVNTTVRVLVTSDPDGVIHSWALPAFGVKLDAVPGRVNETWFRVEREGSYYGQCSELCGTGHGFMPIKVIAMSQADYDAWLTRAKEQFALRRGEQKPTRLAAVAR